MTDPTLASQPAVSVIVPMLNEEMHIAACLDSLLAQEYPPDKLEVLVVDGGSTDRSREIVEVFVSADSRVRLLENPRVLASAALNVGLAAAAGDIVIRMDAHGRAPAHYVSSVVAHLTRRDVDHVGVLLHAVGGGYWGDCIALGITSRFGTGGSRYRTSGTSGSDEMGWSGGYWRDRVRALGGFDETVGTSDDEEFAFRLAALGRGFYRTADVRLEYFNRSSLPGLWKQFFRYGFYKPFVLLKHRVYRMRYFVPPGFVLACLALLVLVLVGRVGIGGSLWIAIPYVATAAWYALHDARKDRLSRAAGLPLVYLVLHVSYGSGFILGTGRLCARWLRSRLEGPGRVRDPSRLGV